MSKVTLEKVDLPGREIYRVMRDGKCIKTIGDGNPLDMREMMALAAPEPPREPEPELPPAMARTVAESEARHVEARALFEKADVAYWQAKDAVLAVRQRARERGSYPPASILSLEEAERAAWARREEAQELELAARCEMHAAQQRAYRWRIREKATQAAAVREAVKPATLPGRIRALAGLLG
jgi:hypothetical protein